MEFCNGNLFCNNNSNSNNIVSCDCVKLRPIWLQSIADLAKAAETTTSHMGRDSQKQSETDTERDLSALKLSYISHSFVNCPKVAPFGVEILIEIRHQLCELSVRGGHQASQQINFIVSVSLSLSLPLSLST